MNEGHQPEDPLAAWAGKTLKQLPMRPAPATLTPRVLAVLARRNALPWFRRPWFLWPRPFQLLAAFASAVVIGFGVWFLLPHADVVSLASAREAAAQFEPVREVSATAGIVRSLGGAMILVVKNLNGWLLAGILGLCAMIWSTTLGLGTVCWRLASGSR